MVQCLSPAMKYKPTEVTVIDLCRKTPSVMHAQTQSVHRSTASCVQYSHVGLCKVCLWLFLNVFDILCWVDPSKWQYLLSSTCVSNILGACAFFLFFFLLYRWIIFLWTDATDLVSLWLSSLICFECLPSILWAKWYRYAGSVKKQKLFEWVKRSLFSCPHLSTVLSLVCLARVYKVPKHQAVSEHPLKTSTGSVYKH